MTPDAGAASAAAKSGAPLARIGEFLAARGYTRSDLSATALESIPDAPGVFVIFALGPDEPCILGVHPALAPGLRGHLRRHLERSGSSAMKANGVAFRLMPPTEGESEDGHHRRLIVEQAAVVEGIRPL
jgi:hypothetical protein